MYCPKCGSRISPDDAKFCHNCGFNLSALQNAGSAEPKQPFDSSIKGESVPSSSSAPMPMMHSEKTYWWKSVNTAQIVILAIGGVFIFGLVLFYALTPSQVQTSAVVFTLTGLVLTLFLLVWKEKTWGWGWYILFGLTYIGVERAYTKYGIYSGLLEIAAVIIALAVYSLFRTKVLTKVRVVWRRSLYSGIIAYFAAGIVTAIIAVFIPTLDQRVAKVIESESALLLANVRSFTDQNNELWSQFVSEPATSEDFQTNLRITQAAIPLYRHKDSILVLTMNAIHRGIKDIYDESVTAYWSLGYTPSDFHRLVDRSEDISTYDELMLCHLSSYYQSVLSGDGKQDIHWKSYEQSQERLNSVAQEFAQLYKQFFGNDMFEQSSKSRRQQ